MQSGQSGRQCRRPRNSEINPSPLMNADVMAVAIIPPVPQTTPPIRAPHTRPMLDAAKKPDIIVALACGRNSVKRAIEVTTVNSNVK